MDDCCETKAEELSALRDEHKKVLIIVLVINAVLFIVEAAAGLIAHSTALLADSLDIFQKSYDETLSACNGCHTEAGYKFIHIVRPTAPPVSNQRWRDIRQVSKGRKSNYGSIGKSSKGSAEGA